MIISDKQELKRCVKQAVRRVQIAECCLDFDMQNGPLGVDALMDEVGVHPGKGTPFGENGAAFYAALDALELPARDLSSARSIQQSYERHAYIREVLDSMRARRVLVTVDCKAQSVDFYGEDRISPMIAADESFFEAGRYGVDYAQLAKRLEDMLAAMNSKDLMIRRFDENALRYCAFPVCEDVHAVLHVLLKNEGEIGRFCALLESFPSVRAVVHAASVLDGRLIDAAAEQPRLLPVLSSMDHLEEALAALGTRFIPFTCRALSPDMMLGRWIVAKEAFWQALCDAYLPLARSGYPLESGTIEKDVQALLGGNLLSLYE